MPLRWLLVAAIALVPGTTNLGAQLPSDLPPPAWQPTGARVTWKGLSFIVPPGMSGSAKGDLYELIGLGMCGRGGTCGITISGDIPSRGDLAAFAQARRQPDRPEDQLAVFPNGGKPEVHLIRVIEDFAVLTPSRSTVQHCKVKVDVAGPQERCLSRR